MTIDINQIKPGDTIRLKDITVMAVYPSVNMVYVNMVYGLTDPDNVGLGVDLGEIAEHIQAPKKIEVGSKVVSANDGEVMLPGVVIAICDDLAWVKWSYGPTSWALSALKVVG